MELSEFNTSISDLPIIHVDAENNTAKIGILKTVSCIFWGDDLVMISETEEGPTTMMETLSEFASQNGLKTTIYRSNKRGKKV